MPSFRNVNFGERGQDGRHFPRQHRKAVSNVVHTLDGSNRVQYSGKTSDTMSLVVKVTEADLNTLYSYVATSGTLIWSGGTVTAFLDEVDSRQPLGVFDVFFATLTFVFQ